MQLRGLKDAIVQGTMSDPAINRSYSDTGPGSEVISFQFEIAKTCDQDKMADTCNAQSIAH
jgi:hypothetical protein